MTVCAIGTEETETARAPAFTVMVGPVSAEAGEGVMVLPVTWPVTVVHWVDGVVEAATVSLLTKSVVSLPLRVRFVTPTGKVTVSVKVTLAFPPEESVAASTGPASTEPF